MMKKNLLLPGIVAASLMSLPVYAHSSKPAAQNLDANSAAANAAVQKAMQEITLFRVWEPVSRELIEPYAPGFVTAAKLRTLDNFSFSPASQTTFKEIFGTEQPILINTRDGENGALEINYLMRALNYTDPKNGNLTSWDILTGKRIYSKDLRNVHSEFSWSALTLTYANEFAVEIQNIQFEHDTVLNARRLPLGTAHMHVDQLELKDSEDSDKNLKMENLQFSAEFARTGKTLELGSEIMIATSKIMGRQIGPVHLDYRIANLNESAISGFFEKLRKLNASQASISERTKTLQKLKPGEFMAMLTPESRFELKDFSVNYQNWKAVLSGAVWLDHVTQAELSQPKMLKNKLAVHFELAMPRGLALKIAKNFSRLGGSTVADSDQQAEKLLQNLSLQGMFSEDGDNLHSIFDFSHGVMNLNGHVLGGAKK